MFRPLVVLLFLLSCASAQELKTHAAAASQTARQALIEMLTTNKDTVVEKHLPEALLTRMNAYKPKDAKPTNKAILNSKDFQVFDRGPVFLVYMPPNADQKLEVLVDRDEPTAEGHKFAFSFRMTRDGKEVNNAIVPKLLAEMKQENGIWRLAQVGFSLQVQLDDGAKLDELMRSAMSAMATASAQAQQKPAAEGTPTKRTEEWTPAKPAK